MQTPEMEIGLGVQGNFTEVDGDLQGYLAHKKHPPPRTLQ